MRPLRVVELINQTPILPSREFPLPRSSRQQPQQPPRPGRASLVRAADGAVLNKASIMTANTRREEALERMARAKRLVPALLALCLMACH